MKNSKIILSATLFSFLFSIPSYAKFTSEDEVSLLVAGGNTDLETYLVKTKNEWSFTKNVIGFGGHYTYGTSEEVENARNWQGFLRYDRTLSDLWGIYIAEIVEGDKFTGIKQRYNSDLGSKLTFIKTDKNKSLAEVGFRHTVERRIEDATVQQQKARVYAETDHKFKKYLSGKLWAEYLPNFTVATDWQLSFEASLKMSLTDIFSLKLAYLGRYDHLPVDDNKDFDFQYTTALLAKF